MFYFCSTSFLTTKAKEFIKAEGSRRLLVCRVGLALLNRSANAGPETPPDMHHNAQFSALGRRAKLANTHTHKHRESTNLIDNASVCSLPFLTFPSLYIKDIIN